MIPATAYVIQPTRLKSKNTLHAGVVLTRPICTRPGEVNEDMTVEVLRKTLPERYTQYHENSPGALYAHHGNAESPDNFQAIRSLQLRHILHGSQNGRGDTEKCRPSCDVFREWRGRLSGSRDWVFVQENDGGYYNESAVTRVSVQVRD